jgi:hypothetical protein
MLQELASSAISSVEAESEYRLHSLIHYIKLHFADEEQFMTSCGYPQLQAHEAEHARLIEQMEEIVRHFAPQITASKTSCIHFAVGWNDTRLWSMNTIAISVLGTAIDRSSLATFHSIPRRTGVWPGALPTSWPSTTYSFSGLSVQFSEDPNGFASRFWVTRTHPPKLIAICPVLRSKRVAEEGRIQLLAHTIFALAPTQLPLPAYSCVKNAYQSRRTPWRNYGKPRLSVPFINWAVRSGQFFSALRFVVGLTF